MLNINKAFKNDRLTKALTGMSIAEFHALIPSFITAFLAERKRRGIRVNFGRTPILSTIELKLFFILFYVKCYPTFDLSAFIFDTDKHRCHDWVKELLPVLRLALKKEIVLPKRKISTPEEFFRLFPTVKEIWVDGTERPIQRPKNKRKQEKRYSGKKKRHGMKNIIVNDGAKRILIVTPTVSGRHHDYAITQKTKLPQCIPKDVSCQMDTGFQGLENDFPHLTVLKPKRASRGHPLTKREKRSNRKISKTRILVEHAIGGIKRMRSLTDTFRGKSDTLSDTLILVSAGLWNFHLKTAAS